MRRRISFVNRLMLLLTTFLNDVPSVDTPKSNREEQSEKPKCINCVQEKFQVYVTSQRIALETEAPNVLVTAKSAMCRCKSRA